MKTLLLAIVVALFSFSAYPADPPPAAQVFQVNSQITDPNTVVIGFTIEPGFFLYRDRIHFKLAPEDKSSVQLGMARFPAPSYKMDKESGRYPIYRGRIAIPLPVLAHQAGDINIIVHYQGCADSGFCYPPTDKQLILTADKSLAIINSQLSDVTAVASQDATEVSTPSDSEQANLILSHDNPFLVVLTFFGFGLLLAFTPCVLPMIPVLSGIIVGKGHHLSTKKAFLLSLCYVLSMSLTYALAGVVIAGLGANIQVALQAPWAIVSFSLVFVLLALSMFGFYDIQLPASWQAKIANVSRSQHGGDYLGVAIMGSLSSLILSPCITAPLVGALSYIANTGNMALGGTALFFLSLGMGSPLLLIGTSAGKLVPRAGHWMNAVKAFFGVLLLGTAIYLISRVIPASLSLALWASLLIVSSIFLGALNPSVQTAYEKLWKGVGIILLFYGALLIVGASMGNTSALQPLASLNGGMGQRVSQTSNMAGTYRLVKSTQDVKQALKEAKQLGKVVMLDFYADWCISCTWMEKNTFSSPEVRSAMRDIIWLKADVTANDAIDKALEQSYSVVAPPTFLFFDKQGREIRDARIVGEKNAKQFLSHLRQLTKTQ